MIGTLLTIDGTTVELRRATPGFAPPPAQHTLAYPRDGKPLDSIEHVIVPLLDGSHVVITRRYGPGEISLPGKEQDEG